MIVQSLTFSDHKYVELQIKNLGGYLHIQGKGTNINRDYGVAINTKTKKLDHGTRTWLFNKHKGADLRSLASGSAVYYFSCQARILDSKCHIQIPGETHNRSYGAAFDVINNELYTFINVEMPIPIPETVRIKVIELSRKIKKILWGETFSSITTKASVVTMLPKTTSVFKTKQGNFGNSYWLLKPQWITKALEKRIATVGLSSSQLDTDKLDISSDKCPAIYKHSIMNKASADTYKIAVFVNPIGDKAGYKEDYIAWLRKNIYKFSLRFGDPKDPATIMSFDQVAGYLMPVKI